MLTNITVLNKSDYTVLADGVIAISNERILQIAGDLQPKLKGVRSEKAVIKALCEHYSIDTDAIYSNRRDSASLKARLTTYYVFYHFLGYSYSKVGQLLGKHHATIMHGVSSVEVCINKYKDALQLCRDIVDTTEPAKNQTIKALT